MHGVRVNGKIHRLEEEIALDRYKAHTIEIVVDRITLSNDNRERLADSLEIALNHGNGVVLVSFTAADIKERFFSEINACVDCGISYGELSPRMFSFNSPYGACTVCNGLGSRMIADPELIVPDPHKSLKNGAIAAWRFGGHRLIIYLNKLLRALAEKLEFELTTPYEDLPERTKRIIMFGAEDLKLQVHFRRKQYNVAFEGVVQNIERRYRETESSFMKQKLEAFLYEGVCPECKGARLKPESLAVRIDGKSIDEITALSVKNAAVFFDGLVLSEFRQNVGSDIIKEIKRRLQFLVDVGIDYLTLDRKSGTLSGGEAQRIRLATQIGPAWSESCIFWTSPA